MSNKLTTNPIVIDTFNSDFTIGGPGIMTTIVKILFKSAVATDVFALEDTNGNKVVVLKQNAELQVDCDFPEGLSVPNGVVFNAGDTNAGLDNGTDLVLIYTR